MIHFAPMQPADVLSLDIQHSQINALGIYTRRRDLEYGRELVGGGPSWAARTNDGALIALAGFTELFPTHAASWALLGAGIGRWQLPITRFVKARFAASPYRRIEAMTFAHDRKAAQWCRMIGMRGLPPYENCGPTCETMILFDWVQ
jgi:hypothetical protein